MGKFSELDLLSQEGWGDRRGMLWDRGSARQQNPMELSLQDGADTHYSIKIAKLTKLWKWRRTTAKTYWLLIIICVRRSSKGFGCVDSASLMTQVGSATVLFEGWGIWERELPQSDRDRPWTEDNSWALGRDVWSFVPNLTNQPGTGPPPKTDGLYQ